MMIWIRWMLLGGVSFAMQAGNPSPASKVLDTPVSQAALSPSAISALEAKSEAGDSTAQLDLARAYRDGNGVPKNEVVAVKWFREAADQRNPAAENSLGTMYRLGEGTTRDKEEAVRWFRKAAHDGSAQGMFNLGTCYYNGDGVGSNEFTAYAWFLLAQETGDPAADDAVKRATASMSKKEQADSLVQIGEMYEKGEELPKDQAQALRWLRKAAELDSGAKVKLAGYLLMGPEGPAHYAEAIGLCREAAADSVPAQYCVGYLYRHGTGANRDLPEALNWYQKSASRYAKSAFELAEMYEAGEGTGINKPEAFFQFFRAGAMGLKGAYPMALAVWDEMNKSEQKKSESKLQSLRLEPKKAIADLRALPPN